MMSSSNSDLLVLELENVPTFLLVYLLLVPAKLSRLVSTSSQIALRNDPIYCVKMFMPTPCISCALTVCQWSVPQCPTSRSLVSMEQCMVDLSLSTENGFSKKRGEIWPLA